MSRRARLGVGSLLGFVLLLTLPLAGPAAASPTAPAQTPPLIPVDTLVDLLAPLQPVLEVISPVAWPACANAVIVSVLPGALGIDIPPEAATVLGPLLVLCGSVPEPGTNKRVCGLDTQAQALLADITKPLLGTALPIEIAPAKWVSGLLDNIVDLVDQPQLPIGSTVAGVLQCVTGAAEATSTPATAPTPDTSTVPVSIDLPPAPTFDPPTFAELQTLPPLEPAAVNRPAAPVVTPELRFIDQPRFRYPVVMGLPLLLLALVAFFGRALTRPLLVDDAAPAARPPDDGAGR